MNQRVNLGDIPEYRRGTPAVGQKALRQIKAFLGDQKPGFIAGTFQHCGGRSDLDPREWAKVLRVREQAGEELSIAQKEAWRAALGFDRYAPA